MDLFYSDLCLFGETLPRRLEKMTAMGATHIEVMMDGDAWDCFEDRAEELLQIMRGFPVVYSLHSPCWDVNMTSASTHVRRASLQSALDAIDFAAKIPCRHLVIHPGFCQIAKFDRVLAKERALEALTELCAAARRKNVRLAVENVGFKGTSLYTQEEYVRLLDGFGPEAGYILDVGHALLNNWNPAQVVRDTASRMYAMHLHDNDGMSDSHVAMGDGIADWNALLAEMTALPDSCNLVAEYNFTVPLERVFQAETFLNSRLTVR